MTAATARFSRAHVPHSWNIHLEELEAAAAMLREEARPYIAVLANRGKTGPAVWSRARPGAGLTECSLAQFARRLVYRHFNRVAVLTGGMDALRTAEACRSMSLCTCRPVEVDLGQLAVPVCSLVRS